MKRFCAFPHWSHVSLQRGQVEFYTVTPLTGSAFNVYGVSVQLIRLFGRNPAIMVLSGRATIGPERSN